jgi:hypothetical protein
VPSPCFFFRPCFFLRSCRHARGLFLSGPVTGIFYSRSVEDCLEHLVCQKYDSNTGNHLTVFEAASPEQCHRHTAGARDFSDVTGAIVIRPPTGAHGSPPRGAHHAIFCLRLRLQIMGPTVVTWPTSSTGGSGSPQTSTQQICSSNLLHRDFCSGDLLHYLLASD